MSGVAVNNHLLGARVLIHREQVKFEGGRHSHFIETVVRLECGANEVDGSDWNLVMSDPSNVKRFQSWGFEVRDKGLKDFSVSESLAMVRETVDPQTLANWEASESRTKVLRAIKDHRATIRENM